MTASKIEIHAFAQEDRSEWDRYALSHPDSTFYHQIAWKEVIEKSYGCKPRYFVAREGMRTVGLLPLFEVRTLTAGKALVSLPFSNYGGAIADSPPLCRQLLDEAIALSRRKEFLYIELKQKTPLEFPGIQANLGYHSLTLSLPPDPKELWRRSEMHSARNQTRKALKSGLRVGIGEAHREAFFRLYLQAMRDHGTPNHGRKWFEKIWDSFGGDAEVVVSYLNDIPLSGALLLFYRGTALLKYLCSAPKAPKVSADNLTYWTAIEHCCKNGYRELDLGRSRAGSGAYRYKLQWGARPSMLHYQYYLNGATDVPLLDPSNARYGIAIKFWKKLPISIASCLGPLIRPYITT